MARERVLGEGSIPADVLLIGEGPGNTEDLKGVPFCGRAGKILRPVLLELDCTWYLTNLVCCHPTNKIGGSNRTPTADEVYACMPRLLKQIDIVKPKVIIFLGREAEKYLKGHFPAGKFAYHPAYILRNMSALVTMRRQIFEAVKGGR